MTNTLGLDVGGANLKAAHGAGVALSRPFALWREPDRLPEALLALLGELPPFDDLAVTMTGELCDCFATRRDGVDAILTAVERAAGGRPVRVWQTSGRFVDAVEARSSHQLTAAANWLALATYAGRFAPEGPALLVDVGSTTTDVVPLLDGQPVPAGRTDTERLRTGELVYTGVGRTPVCALLGSAVMAELFATTLDVYLLLGLAEESDDRHTADGRPATKANAHARLARMTGGDAETCPLEEVQKLARQAAAVQEAVVEHAVRRVARALPARPARAVVSGAGEFLAARALRREGVAADHVLSLAHHLGPSCSAAACAHAVMVLARERRHG